MDGRGHGGGEGRRSWLAMSELLTSKSTLLDSFRFGLSAHARERGEREGGERGRGRGRKREKEREEEERFYSCLEATGPIGLEGERERAPAHYIVRRFVVRPCRLLRRLEEADGGALDTGQYRLVLPAAPVPRDAQELLLRGLRARPALCRIRLGRSRLLGRSR
jgi:hypothetical protein